ncbi:MAG: hypothetical protein QS98_C0009G0008 [archaeon GW2011_AR3]|nr:MAG: hypothetical protein QS98_C0009G0008 [archaeon GW2011_AR3]
MEKGTEAESRQETINLGAGNGMTKAQKAAGMLLALALVSVGIFFASHALASIRGSSVLELGLSYGDSAVFDLDNDGTEELDGVIDFSVIISGSESTDSTSLAVRWEVQNLDEGQSEFVCFGSSEACALVGLIPSSESWDEKFYLYYGNYGSSFHNVVKAQAIYAENTLNAAADGGQEPKILYSEWEELKAEFVNLSFENGTSSSIGSIGITFVCDGCEALCQDEKCTGYILNYVPVNTTVNLSIEIYGSIENDILGIRLPLGWKVESAPDAYLFGTDKSGYAMKWKLSGLADSGTQEALLRSKAGNEYVQGISFLDYQDLGVLGIDKFEIQLGDYFKTMGTTYDYALYAKARENLESGVSLKAAKPGFDRNEVLVFMLSIDDELAVWEEGNIQLEIVPGLRSVMDIVSSTQYGTWTDAGHIIEASAHNYEAAIDPKAIQIREILPGQYEIRIDPAETNRAGLYYLELNITTTKGKFVRKAQAPKGTVLANFDLSSYAKQGKASLQMAFLDSAGFFECYPDIRLKQFSEGSLIKELARKDLYSVDKCTYALDLEDIQPEDDMPDAVLDEVLIDSFAYDISAQTRISLGPFIAATSPAELRVTRNAPTLFDPIFWNAMEIEVQSNYGLYGDYIITDFAPNGIEVYDFGDAEVMETQEGLQLKWIVNGDGRNSMALEYKFRPKLVGRAQFAFGPASASQGELVVNEPTQWQAASEPRLWADISHVLINFEGSESGQRSGVDVSCEFVLNDGLNIPEITMYWEYCIDGECTAFDDPESPDGLPLALMDAADKGSENRPAIHIIKRKISAVSPGSYKLRCRAVDETHGIEYLSQSKSLEVKGVKS